MDGEQSGNSEQLFGIELHELELQQSCNRAETQMPKWRPDFKMQSENMVC